MKKEWKAFFPHSKIRLTCLSDIYSNYSGILTTNIMVVESREGHSRQNFKKIYISVICLLAAVNKARQREKVMWAEICELACLGFTPR